ncbi:Uncharacterised protein PB.4703, partial [Pycnogonum litorale]
GLGISLEGTVDVENGQEVRPHHYIRSILEDGPVGENSTLKSGDELLEVNGRKLLGLNHVEVVTILKELPIKVRMVCARLKVPLTNDQFNYNIDESVKQELLEIGSTRSLQKLMPMTDRLVKAKSDGSLAAVPSSGMEASFSRMKSRSLEPLTGLATWSSEPQIIELIKGDKGLGFSILDYQDPLNPNETVIVIRSLVPGGVAQLDGRLKPGDRLMFVNEMNLENSSLETAVQSLKGAPKGVVRIGVAKPLPLPDSATISDPHQIDRLDLHLPLMPDKVTVTKSTPNKDGVSVDTSVDEKWQNVADGIIINKSSMTSDLMLTPGSTTSLSYYGSESRGSTPTSMASPGMSPCSSPCLGRWGTDIIPLPAALERSIKIKKGSDQFGINIEVVEKGINGALVRSISKTGAIQKDGRIQVGDYLMSVNNETMRQVTNSQARAILRRTHLICTDISVTYVPGPDAAIHKDSVLIALREGQSLPSSRSSSPSRIFPRQLSPSSPYFKPRISDGGSSDEEFIQRISRVESDEQMTLDKTNGSEADCIFDNMMTTSSRDDDLCLSSRNSLKTDISLDELSDSHSVEQNGGDSGATLTQNTNTVNGGHEQILNKSPTVVESLVSDVTLPIDDKNLFDESHSSSGLKNSKVSEISDDNTSVSSSVMRVSPSVKSDAPSPSRTSPSVVSDAAPPRTIKNPLLLTGCQWGKERVVEIHRVPNKSLGISIVGGKIDLFNMSHNTPIAGIFIKNVLSDSPAGSSGALKTGDRILEVDDVNLREVTHDDAVKVIQKARSPVKFLVQSLINVPNDENCEDSDGMIVPPQSISENGDDGCKDRLQSDLPKSPVNNLWPAAQNETSELVKTSPVVDQNLRVPTPTSSIRSPSFLSESGSESGSDIDERNLQGKMYT